MGGLSDRRRPLTSPSTTHLLGRHVGEEGCWCLESVVLLQTGSLCVSSPSQWRGRLYFFFLIFRENLIDLNKVLCSLKVAPKEDCILTGYMNEHKGKQRSTTQILFTQLVCIGSGSWHVVFDRRRTVSKQIILLNIAYYWYRQISELYSSVCTADMSWI